MSNFRVGQKVVCVVHFDDRRILEHGWSIPVQGNVYTVRDKWLDHNGEPGITLEEVVNPFTLFSDGAGGEPHFCATGFRPLVEKRTDISVFTRMLDRVPRRVPEDA